MAALVRSSGVFVSAASGQVCCRYENAPRVSRTFLHSCEAACLDSCGLKVCSCVRPPVKTKQTNEASQPRVSLKERCFCARYCEICDGAFPHAPPLSPRRTPLRSRLAGCYDAVSNACDSLELSAQRISEKRHLSIYRNQIKQPPCTPASQPDTQLSTQPASQPTEPARQPAQPSPAQPNPPSP